MVLRDAVHHVGIARVGEGARAARHAQVLEAVFQQHRDFRRASLPELRFHRGDAAIKNLVGVKLHLDGLAEIQLLPVKVEKIDGVGFRAPIAEARITVIHAVHAFHDGE